MSAYVVVGGENHVQYGSMHYGDMSEANGGDSGLQVASNAQQSVDAHCGG